MAALSFCGSVSNILGLYINIGAGFLGSPLQYFLKRTGENRQKES
ncbi:hypothetical protein GCWU000342_02274 [Shuttleworthella satelles DSM 14600]|uniref:Uncharacterized protein n=1 Tax=Shuttleworthella satelles DSM 14600 TaxID=626523 RepID=C4GDV0_9FIRM|nr:hypothetical protein GCWU000342_02274 [Shuttleworthia satelles DSM 14600]